MNEMNVREVEHSGQIDKPSGSSVNAVKLDLKWCMYGTGFQFCLRQIRLILSHRNNTFLLIRSAELNAGFIEDM